MEPFTDVLLSLLSLLLFLVDVVLDVWAVACLYEEHEYFSMGLLIWFLLASSVLLQTFSWIWYSDSTLTPETTVETFVSRHSLLGLVHVCQLGIFLRSVAVTEISICRFQKSDLFQKVVTSYMYHDISMLRLFEAFSKNAPQIVLMMVLVMERQEIRSFAVIKIISSFSCLFFTTLFFHRTMRAFVPEKYKMGWSSATIYFLWNLFLIGPRVVTVSLSASVLPYYGVAHFLSLWTLLVLWAWWQQTDFMDTKTGEWLYRATVSLTWYFSWFNVASGNAKLKGIIYHTVMGADTMLLLVLWWLRRSAESARLGPLPINPYLLIALLMMLYITGVALKLLYYWKVHPNQSVLQMNVKDEKFQNPEWEAECSEYEETLDENPSENLEPENTVLVLIQQVVTGIHKRINKTAINSYG